MSIVVKHSGSWTTTGHVYVKDGGVWKEVQDIYVKSNDAWEQVHSSELIEVLSANTDNVDVSSLFSTTAWASSREKTVIVSNGVVVSSGDPTIPAMISGDGRGGSLILTIDGSVVGANGTISSVPGGDAIFTEQDGIIILGAGEIIGGTGYDDVTHGLGISNVEHVDTSSFTGSVSPILMEFLIVGGGGGGGGPMGGGGGAGGYIASEAYVFPGSLSLPVAVGVGGNGGADYDVSHQQGYSGANSTFLGLIAIGGGGGNGYQNGRAGYSGGSGGGASAINNAGNLPGLGTLGQGHDGGVSIKNGNTGSGGGGAGAPGEVATNGVKGGDGGAGLQWLDGNWYAGGGGGGIRASLAATQEPGSGGIGGGGTGSESASLAGGDGSTNTGGGGGGGAYAAPNPAGGKGGSGIVAVRYLGPPIGTGGTITESDGYTYHHFLSSGTLEI